MGLFGLWNYENYLLKSLITSKYARNGLVLLLVYLVTAIVRFHLCLILCMLFTWNNSFDLISPIIISVLIAMTSDTLFQYADTHRPRYEALVDYLMANYSIDNFMRWKRIVLTGILGYILLGLAFVEITNTYIIISLTQTVISFVICDFLEQKLPQTWYNYIKNWWHRPQVKRFLTRLPIITDYQINSKPKKSRKRSSSLDTTSLHSIKSVSIKSIKPKSSPIKPITKEPLSTIAPKPLTPPTKQKIIPIIAEILNAPEIIEVIPPKSPTPPLITL